VESIEHGVLKEVRTERAKDLGNLEGLRDLEKLEKNREKHTLHQEDRVLFCKMRLWVTCDLRKMVLES
jgi:hypothetical protein